MQLKYGEEGKFQEPNKFQIKNPNIERALF
jgi:hypothetical protein